MLNGKHSAILSTSIKLPFSIKALILSTFKWPLKTGFTVSTYFRSSNELVYNKRYKLACTPMEESEEHAHLCSLVRAFDGALWVAKGSMFLHAEN